VIQRILSPLSATIGMLLLLSSIAPPTYAQTATANATEAPAEESGALQEVIVTATKRPENLQNVSVAVNAISGDVLQSQQINNLESLQTLVPALTAGDDNGVAKIFMRGVGLNSSSALQQSGVALHVDGAVISRPEAQLTSFFDLADVEVARGPQGTLYGRNAVGGAINLVTAKPTQELSGYFNADLGNYDTLNLAAAIGGPITDVLSARIAFKSEDHAGYGRSIVTGRGVDDLNDRMGRIELLFKPNESFSWLVAGEIFREDDASGSPHKGALAYPDPANPGQSLFELTGVGGYPTNPRDYAGDFDPYTDKRTWAVTSTINYNVNDWLYFVNITNYRDFSYWRGFDYGLSAVVPGIDNSFPLSTYQKGDFSHQFSNELQIHTDFDWMHGILGIYAFHERLADILDFGVNGNSFAGPSVNLNGAAVSGVNPAAIFQACDLPGYAYTNGNANAPPNFCSYTAETNKALAVFGQYEFHLGALVNHALDGFSVKLGGRYNHESLSTYTPGGYAGPTSAGVYVPGYGSKSWNNFSPVAGLDWQVNSNLLVYYTFSEGFISGVAGAFTPGSNSILDPEKLQNHEIGVKATLLDGRATANLAAFKYNLEGLQIQKTVPYSGGIPLQVFENAAGVRASGVEADVAVRPIPSVRLNGSVAYLHSYFSDFKTENPLCTCNIINPTTIGSLAPYESLDGYPTRDSPKVTVNAGGEFDIPGLRLPASGVLTLRGDIFYRSTTYYSEFEDISMGQSGFAMANAYLKYQSPVSKFTASLWVKNLTNKLAVQGAYAFNTQGFIDNQYYPPRTYGLSVGYSF
jgi:iron complex outermembrane recepter protein